ncbi:MAG: hypothetical protein NDF53_04805 [archaeon GB-1867-097]|nr:hypothetical protein [Candidatus Culexmicrobium thermophilum]
MRNENIEREKLKEMIKEKINQLNREIEIYKLCLEILGGEVEEREAAKVIGERKIISEIYSNDGKPLAKIYGEADRIIIVPERNVNVNVNSREFKQFFIRKVLYGIKRENPLVRYEIKDRGGILTEIILRNITSQKEIKRLQGAVKWTFKQFT